MRLVKAVGILCILVGILIRDARKRFKKPFGAHSVPVGQDHDMAERDTCTLRNRFLFISVTKHCGVFLLPVFTQPEHKIGTGWV